MQEANHIVKKLLEALSAAKRQHNFKRTDKFYICYTVRQCTTKLQMCWAVGLWFGLSHPTALTATSPSSTCMARWMKE